MIRHSTKLKPPIILTYLYCSCINNTPANISHPPISLSYSYFPPTNNPPVSAFLLPNIPRQPTFLICQLFSSTGILFLRLLSVSQEGILFSQ